MAHDCVTNVCVLDVVGALVGEESSLQVRDEIESRVRQGEVLIVLNIGRLSHIDEPGFGEIVRALTTLSKNDGVLAVVNAPKHFDELVASMKFL